MATAAEHLFDFETDITKNLNSLQFEIGLTDSERTVSTRAVVDSHVWTVTACAHATYLVSLITSARTISQNLHGSVQKPTSRMSTGSTNSHSSKTNAKKFVVGLVGCGRVGRHLALCFLKFTDLRPEEFIISTRRPETLGDLHDLGVTCVHDNARVAESASLIFLTCLPSQLPVVASELRPRLAAFHSLPNSDTDPISQNCSPLIYSLVAATSLHRLNTLLGTAAVIRPNAKLSFSSDRENKLWDISLDIIQSFGRPEMVGVTCPMSGYSSADQSVLQYNVHCAASLVTAFVHFCASLESPFTTSQLVVVVNALVLGHTKLTPCKEIFSAEDLLSCSSDAKDSNGKASPLCEDLKLSAVQEAFTRRYLQIFQQQTEWINKTTTMTSKPSIRIDWE